MKKFSKKLMLVMFSAAIPNLLLAADAEVQARIQQLEAQLAELKQSILTMEKETRKADHPAPTKSRSAFQYGGFIKADVMFNDYGDGSRPGNIGDEILVPSLIPVGGEGEGVQVDSHIKTSRFFFKTAHDTKAGKISSHFELDLLTGDGDERVSNSAHSRLRHAYLKWDYADDASLLMGQTWSTFFNVGALPESIEFIGPTSGTIFNRQFQARWTKKLPSGGSIMLAAENPSTSLADAGSGIASSNFDDNQVPDLVARYNGKVNNLSYSAAVIGREIAYEDNAISESDYGIGISLAGRYDFANGDDLKFMVSHGNLGRYIALNAFRDGGIDANGSMDLTEVTGGFIAYRHHWTDQWRTTLQYAIAEGDLADGLSSANTETVSNFNINLLYSPAPGLTFGGAWIHAERELENGTDGSLDRVQLMGKYAF